MPGIVEIDQQRSDSNLNTEVVFNAPGALADNDVLYVQLAVDGLVTFTPPAGWTELVDEQTPGGGGDCTFGVWRRVVSDASSEPATYTWTWASGEQVAGNLYCIRGVDNTTPEIVGTTTNSSGGTITIPSVTATADGSALLQLYAVNEAEPYTPNDGLHIARYRSSGGGAAASLGAALELVDSGATGVRTWLAPVVLKFVAVNIIVNPDGSTPNVGYVAGGQSTASSGATTSATLDVPNHDDGDVLVASIATNGAPTVTPPAGWSEIVDDDNTQSGLSCWYRTASSEPATYTWTLGSGEQYIGVMMVLKNVGDLDQTGAVTKSSSTTITGASITPSAASVMIFGAAQDQDLQLVEYTTNLLGGYQVNSGGAARATGFWGWKHIAAASGAQTLTTTGTNGNLGLLFNFLDDIPEPPTPPVTAARTTRSPRYGITRRV